MGVYFRCIVCLAIILINSNVDRFYIIFIIQVIVFAEVAWLAEVKKVK
jgi:hypothetical protein